MEASSFSVSISTMSRPGLSNLAMSTSSSRLVEEFCSMASLLSWYFICSSSSPAINSAAYRFSLSMAAFTAAPGWLWPSIFICERCRINFSLSAFLRRKKEFLQSKSVWRHFNFSLAIKDSCSVIF